MTQNITSKIKMRNSNKIKMKNRSDYVDFQESSHFGINTIKSTQCFPSKAFHSKNFGLRSSLAHARKEHLESMFDSTAIESYESSHSIFRKARSISVYETSLRDRQIEKLPDDFYFRSSQLIFLDLRNNLFSSIPPEIFLIKNLNNLHLDNNNILSLPPEISNLKKLKCLFLSHNALRTLHFGLGQLRMLQILSVDHNSLTEFPNCVCELPDLRKLYLHGNADIDTLPTNIKKIEKLEVFSFDWLFYLPDSEFQTTIEGEKWGKLRRQLNSFDKTCLKFLDFLDSFNKNSLYSMKKTVLHLACQHNHATIVKNLLQNQLDPNVLDFSGNSPLSLAIELGNELCAVELLTNSKVDVNFCSSNKMVPLHLAINKSNFALAQALLNMPSIKVNARDPCMNTALHLLMSKFNSHFSLIRGLCEMLLSLGCDPNAKNQFGMTPLQVAARNKQHLALEFAFEYNYCTKKLFNLNIKGGSQEFSLLHLVALFTNTDILTKLISQGVDVTVKDKKGRTARDLVKNSVAEKILLKAEQKYIQKKVIQLYDKS